jgi:hypothetical protein
MNTKQLSSAVMRLVSGLNLDRVTVCPDVCICDFPSGELQDFVSV